jgi:hypothetical protein
MVAYFRWIWRLGVSMGLLLAGAGQIAQAQATPGTVYFQNAPAPTVVSDGVGGEMLQVQRQFMLLDAAGRVRPDELQTSQLTLGSEVYEPALTKLGEAWAVMALLETGRTMALARANTDYRNARAALVNAIASLPEGAHVGALTFNDTPALLQNFTADKGKVAEAVKRTQAVLESKNVCLNDALFEAITQLKNFAGLTGRRAVLAVTSSADTCGNRSLTDVLRAAQDNQVQIYIAGLKGYVDESNLKPLAEGSYGLSGIQEAATLSFEFGNFVAALNNQWLFTAKFYTTQGPHQASFSTNGGDGTSFTSAVIVFDAPKDFVPPPTLSFKNNSAVVSDRGLIAFKLAFTNPSRIDHLRLGIVPKGGSEPVVLVSPLALTESLQIDTGPNLIRDQDYTLFIEALTADNQPVVGVVESGFAPLQLGQEFTYKPPIANLALTFDKPPAKTALVTVTLNVSNLPPDPQINLWLGRASDQALISETLRHPTSAVAVIYDLDALQFVDGEYFLKAQVADAQGRVEVETVSEAFLYTALTDSEKWLQTEQARWVLGGALGVGLGGGLLLLLIVFWPRGKAKSKVVELHMPEIQRRVLGLEEPLASPEPPARPAPRASAPISPPKRPTATVSAGEATSLRPAVKPMPIVELIAQAPPTLRFSVTVAKTPFTVGRREGNDAVLPVDNASGVSGKHLTLLYENNAFFVRDENSSNGTTVNGQPIPTGEKYRLENGLVIGLGPNVRLMFRVK